MRCLPWLLAALVLSACTGPGDEPGRASPQPPPAPAGSANSSPTPSATTPTAPEADTPWRRLADAPLTPRSGALMVVLRHELLVVGGAGAAPRDSAAYDPRRDRWQRRPDAPPGLSGDDPGATEGDRLYLPARGQRAGRVLEYDASDEIWTAYPGARGTRIRSIAVRDGYVQAAGVTGAVRQLRLRTVVWRRLHVSPLGRRPWQVLWAGSRLVVAGGGPWSWTGQRLVAPFPRSGRPAALDPASGRRRPLDVDTQAPQPFTGAATSSGALVLDAGRLYDDDTGQTVAVPRPPGVEAGSTVIDEQRIYLLDQASRLWVLPVRKVTPG
jgi:hypothetical protein